ncbi:MAG: phycobilisome rod-core linker polypeptide [Pseudanabaenaceae cyanobacterium bins.68]|nr:phycobilisome rod-core linker polypeptide [Pseudanabaenaceae cyanobacterium bins.68]
MLPLLSTNPTTQNHRVPGYEVTDEDDPIIYRLADAIDLEQLRELTWAAYRQVFSEHLILESYRQTFLESQLKNRQISVKEFVRGLGKSEVFRRLVMDTNSNYRLVDLCCTRFLGRSSYGKDEQIALSIVIATQGLDGFIDRLVDSEEYQLNFGDDIVPYQRRRMGERPFNLVTPRYSDYWRAKEAAQVSNYNLGKTKYQGTVSATRVRSGIPAMFLNMAVDLNPAESNYQYAAAGGVSTSRLAIPDMTVPEAASKQVIKRSPSASPYRYLAN